MSSKRTWKPDPKSWHYDMVHAGFSKRMPKTGCGYICAIGVMSTFVLAILALACLILFAFAFPLMAAVGLMSPSLVCGIEGPNCGYEVFLTFGLGLNFVALIGAVHFFFTEVQLGQSLASHIWRAITYPFRPLGRVRAWPRSALCPVEMEYEIQRTGPMDPAK